MPTKNVLRAFVATGSGALLPLSLAPFDVWPLMLVSAAALYALLRNLPTSRCAFSQGWFFGVGKYAIGASWVYVAIHVHGQVPTILAATIVSLFVGTLALFHGAMAWTFHRLSTINLPLGQPFCYAALWTVMEWTLTWFLTGFPWLFAGYAFIETPLAGLAPVGGVLLVSFGAVLTSALLITSVRPVGRSLTIMILASIWFIAWGLKSIDWTDMGKTWSVALVQGNVPQEIKWTTAGKALSKERYLGLTERHLDTDIIVWPEASIPEHGHEVERLVNTLHIRSSGDLIFGTVIPKFSQNGSQEYYNAALSATGGVYRKRHLVPFVEFMPFQSMLDSILGLDFPMANTVRGSEQQPLLQAGGLNVAVAICYEIAYPKVIVEHGGEAAILVTISNDTWFGKSIGPLQHMQIARMRALESGRYLLRATNNGVTAIVNEKGRVKSRLSQFQTGVLTGTVHEAMGQTPFTHFPDLAVLLAILATTLTMLLFYVRR